jgi:isoamylase
MPEVDPLGQPVTDDTFLLLLNGHHEDVPFTLPSCFGAERWEPVFDTALDEPFTEREPIATGTPYELCARSLALLRRV